MVDTKTVPMKEILAKVNGQPLRIINPFATSTKITDIKEANDSGIYNGSGIFDPTKYTTDGTTTPTNDDSALQTYYEGLIKATVGNTNTSSVVIPSITTSQRPKGVVGLTVFDTTLNKMITYNGTSWVDLAGRTV